MQREDTSSLNDCVPGPFDPSLEARLRDTIRSSRIVAEYRKLGVNVERFFTGVDKIGIYECPLTKYRFYYPHSVIGDDAFYDELQAGEKGYYFDDRTEYKMGLYKLDKGESVLEIGCGDGVFLEKLRERGIAGRGIEFNKTAVEKCQAKGLDVQRVSIQDFAERNAGKFDAVVLFQVLEHVNEVSGFIASILTCLKKGGKLIVAVPDNSPYHKNFRIYLTFNLPPHHMGLWNAESLKNLDKIFDLSLVSIEYDDDYSSIPNYVYFLGDLLASRFGRIYDNAILRHLLIIGLIPYTLPTVLKMRFKRELRPHTIVATFRKH